MSRFGRIAKTIAKTLAIGVLLIALAVVVLFFVDRHDTYDQMATTSAIADTSLGPIQYSLVGDDGPVILFLHGTPGGFDHSPFFVSANRPGFRRLTPSRPGYLSTPLEVGRTPRDQARAYAALLDTLGIDEVIVLGVSGGGPSAIAFAAMYPERTEALIGLEIISQAKSEPLEVPAIMKSDFLYWLAFGIMMRLDDGRALVDMMQLPPEQTESLTETPEGRLRLQTWAWCGWPAAPRVPGWLNDSDQFMTMSLPIDQVSAPTLILHGTADNQVPYHQAEELASRIPGARMYTVDGGTHAMLLTHFDELDAVIDAFLAEVIG